MAVTYNYNGEEQTVAEIAKQNGMSYRALSARIKKCNYNVQEALDMSINNKPIDMVGKKYNRLIVLSYAGVNKHNQKLVNYMCECGTEGVAVGHDLRYNKTKSCGCLNTERIITHGMAGTKLYKVWSSMTQRCINAKHPHYSSYGGRGITVCKEWLNSFEAFYADMGDANGLTLDRVDNNKGYSKGNCRWATRKEQSNNIRNNVTVTYKGETKTVSEWSEVTGLPMETIRWRANHNWEADRIIETPLGTPKTANKFTKSVVQLDKNNNVIATFESITEAREATGVSNTSIGYACNGKRATAGGFKWQFAIAN